MGYVIQAVLSSAQHPEYGQITIPFPIPREEYDHTIELLEPLGIGDTLRQDCQVDELDSFYTVLNELTGKSVTLDELDYLAKRLDSFDDGEAAQFQGMAHKLGITQIKDFINLTFCCQRATVITDFSDLKEIGQEHYMNLNGGSASTKEKRLEDGRNVGKAKESHSGADPHADVSHLLGGAGCARAAGGQEKGPGKVSTCPPVLEGL